MLKVMQKKLMEMMKSGEGMEGMQQMLQGMGGMPGMPDMSKLAEGEEPGPEQVKEMLLALKQMKESGAFSKEDLEAVKREFKQSFGTGIDDLSGSEPLNETEKELLDLMKSVLED